jgi:invasion protein IalB
MSPLRIVIPVVLLVVGLVAGWIGHAVLAPPPDGSMVTTYDDWRLGCPKLSDKKGSCALVQDVVDTKSEREIAHLAIANIKGERRLIITVPYDVLLPSGVGLVLGKDKPRVYPYRTCDDNGCIAETKFDDALSKAMQPQPEAKLLLAQLDNKVAALPFSLKGFAKAEAAYKSDQAKRKSWLARVLP